MLTKTAYTFVVLLCIVRCQCESYNLTTYLLGKEHYIYVETHDVTEGAGDQLLESMFSYIGALYHAFKIVESKTHRSRHVTEVLFSDVGPMPIKSRINRTVMRDAYGWTDAEFNYFLALVEHVRILWKKISDTAMEYNFFKQIQSSIKTDKYQCC